MKLDKQLVLSLALALATGPLFAAEMTATVPVMMDIPAEGLIINYDMNGDNLFAPQISPPQKVQCIFTNLYKAELSYSDNSETVTLFHSPNSYGNNDNMQVTFTAQGNDFGNTRGLGHRDQWRIAPVGQIKIVNHDPNSINKAYAHCWYEDDFQTDLSKESSQH